MSDNIVVLSGSPRKGANTDKLAAAFIKGAETAGKRVALYRAADMEIGGCLGCGQCRDGGVCIQKDDMPKILDALKTADALVLASPVYYFGVTAQLKLAIDRMYAQNRQETPLKRAALLLTCGNTSDHVAEGAIAMYEKMLAFYGWERAGVIVAAGMRGTDGIDGRGELDTAERLGRDI